MNEYVIIFIWEKIPPFLRIYSFYDADVRAGWEAGNAADKACVKGASQTNRAPPTKNAFSI